MLRRDFLGSLAAVPALAAPATPVDRCRALAIDWANIARYRDANALVRRPIETVFMGDSITQGWANSEKVFFGSRRVGRGISGQTTPQMLVRFRQDVIALKPRCVHILGGINDIKQNTGPIPIEDSVGNVASMAELARAHDIRVVIAAIMPAYIPGIDTETPRHRFNVLIEDYCRRNRCTFVDYGAIMDDGSGRMKPGMSSDGVHPTGIGYRAMQPLTEAAIRRTLT